MSKSDQSPYDMLERLNLIATIPSIIGTLLMSYFCFRNMNNNTFMKFLFSLAISDLIYSLSNLMSAFDPADVSALCEVEGIMREFSSKLSIWIATSIAIFHCKVVKVRSDFNEKRFLVASLIFGGLISLGFALR